MIKIAICDDELGVCTSLEKILCDILSSMSITPQIDVFYTGEGLCKHLSENDYNIIFLDIELHKMNGIEVGHYIREVLNNDIVEIAYISAKQTYAMDLFAIRPIDFVIKPIDNKQIQTILDVYFRTTQLQHPMFVYKRNKTTCNIPVQNIMYFENSARKVNIITTDFTETYYEYLDTIYERVKKYKFWYVHKSYIINPQYIKNMEYSQITMTNDKIIPISQANRTEVRKAYTKWLKERRIWI